MAKIDITKTEIVWPDKYSSDGNLNDLSNKDLPFQVIERVNESRAMREAKKSPSLFETYEGKEGASFEEGWRNKLIWGDNLVVMSSLKKKFSGGIDLVYIDPPFATGADFSHSVMIGDKNLELLKEQSIIEEKAYRDTWGNGIDSYLAMIRNRLILIYELLSSNGSLIVHLDPTVVHYVKIILDEIFGCSYGESSRPGFRNEIIWCYSGGGIPKKEFPRKHDVLLWYSKGTDWVFNTQYRPYSEGTVQRGRTAVKGENAQLREEGTPINDWWPDVKKITSPTDEEKLYYDTQKSEELLSRIISVASNENQLVADFFCGSGTTLSVSEKLNRRWIGCDLGRYAIQVTRKRLLEIDSCRPFELLNLGKYERQYWQGSRFATNGKTITESSLYEYLAFILKLYGAQPLSGMQHIHGKKGKALVHIGSVDAPVTIDEINASIDECLQLKQSELHILGWEWEMGLAGSNNGVRKAGPMQDIAKQKGIKLILLEIPREVMEQKAVDKNDIKFFELAYLEVDLLNPKKLTMQVKLKNFVIPNTDLIPDDVRSKIKKWSDYIDYWAVDWNFQNDTFIQGWVTYRTRKDRSLALSSDKYEYDKPGKYRILIKVVDIFGNDTSQAYDVEVK